MDANLPDPCPHPWCSVQTYGHTWHEGVIDTWIGRDPHLHDMPRTLQLVAFAPEPLGTLTVRPQLALTITGPDLRRPDRVSLTLGGKAWQRVAERLTARI